MKPGAFLAAIPLVSGAVAVLLAASAVGASQTPDDDPMTATAAEASDAPAAPASGGSGGSGEVFVDLRASAAWTLLDRGRYFQALRHFSRQAGRYPESGTPKIGYAIGAAAAGDLSRGANAMRRALRNDPEAAAALDPTPELRTLIRRLTSLYLWRLERDDIDQDAALMLASLYYLLRHEEAARYAIDLGNGDAPAEQNLKMLIDQWLAPPPEPEPVSVEPAVAPLIPFAGIGHAIEIYPDAPPGGPGPGQVPEQIPDQIPEQVPAQVASEPEPVVAVPQSEVPDHIRVDYEKLNDGLNRIGKALDSFTRKLMGSIKPAG